MEIGERVRLAIKEAGLSARYVNKKLVLREGRSPGKDYIYRVIAGSVEPYFYIIEQISQLTRKPVTYFIWPK